MEISIVGSGNIGSLLARRFAAPRLDIVHATSRRSNPSDLAVYSPRCAPAQRLFAVVL